AKLPERFILPNGLRVLHQQVRDTRVVHLALILDVGSRDEEAHQLGMAHFVEHMLFKGTRSRKPYHILSRIDNVGGDLDAYTTREKTALTITVSREYVDRALDLLHDMAFHSTFPPAEIDKERTVIAEEIDMYDDSPEERIQEQFDALIFPRHELGTPILGTRHSLQAFDRAGLLQYYRTYYRPERAVLSVVGNLGAERLQRLVERYQHSHEAAPPARKPRLLPSPAILPGLQELRPIQQAHYLVGGRALSLAHPHYLPWLLLNNYLGGSAMNSRLNLSVRERHGLSYNAYSYYTPYQDAGIWGVYAALDAENLPRLRRIIRRELDLLMLKPLSPARLAAIKKQFAGTLAISWESGSARMMALAHDWMDGRELLTLPQAIERIRAVEATTLQQVASLLFDPAQLAEAVYLPHESA
ncbi:MAG: insulinase family protein, partial [Bacteroidetes bacterium]|nr:insulinase family protein [Bacteroidota bacterium]